MASILLQYCNGAAGANIALHYNDVTHQVTDGMPVGPCPGPSGLPSGIEIYSQVVGLNEWKVFTQNAPPYAYVSHYVYTPCTAVISSVTIGNATSNYSSDGSMIVNTTSPGSKSYSLDGVNWQVSNQFLNKAPGIYTVRLRVFWNGEYCYDEEVVQVGFTVVTCELQLGTITKTQDTGGSDGTITVNTLVNPPVLPVEYRLDAGAWQNSPTFTGLAAGTYNVQVRYKNYTSCTDDRNIEITDQDCDIVIEQIIKTHEQSKYGNNGRMEIIATSEAGGLEYSIDGGDNWQEGNIFESIVPGVYDVRVRDTNGCGDIVEVEIFKWKAPYLVIPIVNSHRFVIQSGPVLPVSSRQNFDNKLFMDMRLPGVDPSVMRYTQKFELGDIVPFQFRTNYTTNALKIYNAANVLLASLVPTKKTTNLNKTDSRTAYFANYGDNKTQIFFENGMPLHYEIGQDVTISDQATLNGTYEIVDITQGNGAAVGYQVLIIDKIYTSMTAILEGTLDVVYDLEPYEVYEVNIDWNTWGAGEFYAILEGSDEQFDNYTVRSEPVAIKAIWEEHDLIRYKNHENDYLVNYDTGIQFLIRVDSEVKPPVNPGKRTLHEDSRNRMIKVQAYTSRTAPFKAYNMPGYMIEKIALAFDHDYFTVNDVEYQTEEDIEPEYFENDPMANASAQLRQVDFEAENTDDMAGEDVDIQILGDGNTLLGVP